MTLQKKITSIYLEEAVEMDLEQELLEIKEDKLSVSLMLLFLNLHSVQLLLLKNILQNLIATSLMILLGLIHIRK